MLKGVLLIKGKLHFFTPLLIGCGEKEIVDAPVLKGIDGKPYIPGTSVAGVLRHFYYENIIIKDLDSPEKARTFWGGEKLEFDRGQQSAFYISDLLPIGTPTVVIRDGVKIGVNGIAEDGFKYDYEVVEPGDEFYFQLEVKITELVDKSYFKKILSFLLNSMKNREISLGSLTSKGLGRCELREVACWEYDFQRKNDVLAWLNREEDTAQKIDLLNYPGFKRINTDFTLEADFLLKNSLIIRSYTGNPFDPDAVHIKSAGHPILPGTSLKGAIRARALRVINTLGYIEKEEINRLFGWASDKQPKEKYKSRLIVEETEIRNVCSEVQARIKIDRFTGGVMDGALFETMPLWPSGQKKADQEQKPMLKVKLKINDYQTWEAGLMLLILKDLWIADLPIGGEKNVGRGVLQGVKARIVFAGKEYVIENQSVQLGFVGDKGDLEKLVQDFVEKCSPERKEGII